LFVEALGTPPDGPHPTWSADPLRVVSTQRGVHSVRAPLAFRSACPTGWSCPTFR